MAGTLFQFPKAVAWDNGVAQSGATLTFSQTGTSTPQNTYTDLALTTPHSNPVTADSEGLFAPIYLDPNLPDYRVVFRDSAGSIVYTVDDVPAAGSSGNNITLSDTAPYLVLTQTGATANEGKWRIIATGDQLLIQTGNDALDTFATFMTVSRTATVVDSVNFTPTALQFGGETIATISTGSFTGSLTGFASPINATVYYRVVGGMVSLLYFGSTWVGTSTSTAMTMTGIPAALRPSSSDPPACPCIVYDNSVYSLGTAYVASSGTINFTIDANTAFTGSGIKGVPEGWMITYPIGLS